MEKESKSDDDEMPYELNSNINYSLYLAPTTDRIY